MSNNNVVLIVDQSGSMRTFISEVLSGIKEIAETLTQSDANKLKLIFFNDDINEVFNNYANNFKPPSPDNNFRYQPHGLTALYDALVTVLDNVKNEYKKNKEELPAVYLITDGADTGSIYTLIQARDAIKHYKEFGGKVTLIGIGEADLVGQFEKEATNTYTFNRGSIGTTRAFDTITTEIKASAVDNAANDDNDEEAAIKLLFDNPE